MSSTREEATSGPRYAMEAYRPETWPPLDLFKEHWDERFGAQGYRVAEYVVARVEYEHISGHRQIDADDKKPGVFGRDPDECVKYWRLFWCFDGPLYLPFQIETESNPGGPAWRVEAREMRLIPEHERRTIVEAYWAASPRRTSKA